AEDSHWHLKGVRQENRKVPAKKDRGIWNETLAWLLTSLLHESKVACPIGHVVPSEVARDLEFLGRQTLLVKGALQTGTVDGHPVDRLLEQPRAENSEAIL